MDGALEDLLAKIQDSQEVLHLWWRDDDATQPTPAFQRLCHLLNDFAVPAQIAVIPETGPLGPRPDRNCAEFLEAFPNFAVLQHGFRHINHATGSGKKAELGGERDLSAVIAEVSAGRGRLLEIFGSRATKVLVPPWNRISPILAGHLNGKDDWALSSFAQNLPERARSSRQRPVINTHVDLIDWRAPGGRRAVSSETVAAAVSNTWHRNPSVGRSPDRPLGLLSHHAVMDDAAWAIAERLLTAFARSNVVRWIEPFAGLTPGSPPGAEPVTGLSESSA